MEEYNYIYIKSVFPTTTWERNLRGTRLEAVGGRGGKNW